MSAIASRHTELIAVLVTKRRRLYTLSALDALYKFTTYLLTYLLRASCRLRTVRSNEY